MWKSAFHQYRPFHFEKSGNSFSLPLFPEKNREGKSLAPEKMKLLAKTVTHRMPSPRIFPVPHPPPFDLHAQFAFL
jgi:hypothetical protein